MLIVVHLPAFSHEYGPWEIENSNKFKYIDAVSREKQYYIILRMQMLLNLYISLAQ